MNAILQVENLTKQYADFKLDHVSFSVPKGTIMGLIGENGAGKSTTINAILDLIHKDDGTVTFWGQELSSTKQIKEDVGVVFDGINFYETLTPAKVGKIAGAAYKQWDGHLFQDYLKRFQLPADKEIKSLSKGMKMKLCIAVALSHNPKLLILDEATSGLDPVMRDDILDRLRIQSWKIPLSSIMGKGGSTPCCRPLIAYPQRQAGLSTAAQYALFILTVDWLGWLCYSLIIGFPSLSIKGQIPPPVPNFATR